MSAYSTSVVGSLPRPAWVREIFELPLDPLVRKRRLDAAVSSCVAMQEQAGIDVISDGEWRRRSYIGVIADLAYGFAVSKHADGRPWTVVVDKVSSKAPGLVANQARYVKTITSKKVKATLPSPALLAERLWDEGASGSAYATREDFAKDCVPILRQEVGLIAQAGIDVIQIDDPHLCLFVDPNVRAGYEDPDAAAGFAVDIVNEILRDVDGPRVAVHLCRRAGARVRGDAQFEGGYGPIINHVNRLHVDEVTMEFSDGVAGEMSVLEELRPDFGVGLGCVSVTPGQLDTVDEIVARVKKAAQYVDPARISLNPDCGFAPGSGARVDPDEVFEKLCRLVEASEQLRAE